ncbi:putative RTA1-like protein [Mycena kentingensis (nom. inval.)]|nr:putative RTA1-like protein [Mycena kentingensis (nom. inval.)]
MPPAIQFSPYGYVPTKAICALFVALFSTSTLAHLAQAAHYRLWWLLPTACFAGLLEILGWSARLWSSIRPHMFDAVQSSARSWVYALHPPLPLSLLAHAIQPTPLAAANFVILGHIITKLGTQYSRLSPGHYTALFVSCDVISLIIQGIGGGIAAVAVNQLRDPERGGNIMLGGIVFQLATISAYALCAGEFLLRFLRNQPLRPSAPSSHTLASTPKTLTRRLQVLLAAMVFTTTCLLIRAVYRVVELSDGWSGRVIHTQVYFNVLDGAMITLAMFTVNLAHPGFLLRDVDLNQAQSNAKEHGAGSETPQGKEEEKDAEADDNTSTV